MEEDEDYEDGIPMDGAALLKGVMKHGVRADSPTSYNSVDNVDGVPRMYIIHCNRNVLH